MNEEFRKRLPIAEWPELERKMGIISRMTSDPPLESPKKETHDSKPLETAS